MARGRTYDDGDGSGHSTPYCHHPASLMKLERRVVMLWLLPPDAMIPHKALFLASGNNPTLNHGTSFA